jgi:hypothetical protein
MSSSSASCSCSLHLTKRPPLAYCAVFPSYLQVKKFFRPEFLNRLDDIVVFDPLSAHQLLGVAGLMAHELNDRLKSKNITLKTTDNALQYAVSQVRLEYPVQLHSFTAVHALTS